MRLLDGQWLYDVGLVLTKGGDKYGDDNWQRGNRGVYVDAMVRHMAALLSGEEYDRDTGLQHTAHITANAMFLHFFIRSRQGRLTDRRDTRYRYPTEGREVKGTCTWGDVKFEPFAAVYADGCMWRLVGDKAVQWSPPRDVGWAWEYTEAPAYDLSGRIR
jgi:hypothetical protein